MFEHLRIPNEREFENASAKQDCFEPVADPCRFSSDTVSRATFAANDASASEAALILTESRATTDSRVAARAVRSPLTVSRITDVIIAGTLCIVLLPVLAFIAVYLKVLERGPVFFAHRRIGMGGKPFPCLKFRTMSVDADQALAQLLAANEEMRSEWSSTQKLICDPRVTRFGRILRNSSLDELPQLINVLRGEMSIVGPRPVIEDEMRRYGRYAALYASVRPGLTGLWQVTRNAQTSYRRRVATDVCYVRNRTLALDFRILLATIPVVLFGNG
jgi:exopolysaccharide production protein ExoY